MGEKQQEPSKPLGNLLGEGRAEIDNKMLAEAFVKTSDYQALTSTFDFNFVVGRRGTGKTALFIKVAEYFKTQPHQLFLHEIRPDEAEALLLRSVLEKHSSDYRTIRAITRVSWRAHLLLTVLTDLISHWRFSRVAGHDYLRQYSESHKKLVKEEGLRRCADIVRQFSQNIETAREIPGAIATALDLENLQRAIQEALVTLKRSAVFMFDGLDEGWEPTGLATAIIGGLALAVADFRDKKSEIRGILFLRDNIFRALAHLDPDFSRHIEGSALRLHWENDALLQLVVSRLRIRLELEHIESSIRIWNRFAQRKLQDRQGFSYCLRYTLRRPRDILVLLNQTFLLASRGNRSAIIEDDVEIASKQISLDRLNDLLKEYDAVFPGLQLLVQSFVGCAAVDRYESVTQVLDNAIAENSFTDSRASDFAILESGSQAFDALYGVGFFGFEELGSGNFSFSHDGAYSARPATKPDQKIAIHPCYWKALDTKESPIPDQVLMEIHDEYETHQNPELQDSRVRMLGQLVTKLPQMELGDKGSTEFEDWVHRTIRILFAGNLANPKLHPNGQAIQRRDIVATNMANDGFWKRVFDDYQSRQVIFEVKTYIDLKLEDIRQGLSYTGGPYGRFVIIVSRSGAEVLDSSERGWVQEMYQQHQCLVFLLPAMFLARCLRKIRKAERYDYTDSQLNKRLDTFERDYLAIRHQSQKSRNKNKK